MEILGAAMLVFGSFGIFKEKQFSNGTRLVAFILLLILAMLVAFSTNLSSGR